MIGDILQPTHLLFVLVIALLVLGPKRLPEVGRALGKGLRDFRNAVSSDELREQMVSTTTTENAPPVAQSSPPQFSGESPTPSEPSTATEPPTAVTPSGDQAPQPSPATPAEPQREPAATAPVPDRTQ